MESDGSEVLHMIVVTPATNWYSNEDAGTGTHGELFYIKASFDTSV